MEKLYNVVLTTTYAGETLSIAAAHATLRILRDEPVLPHIWKMGERLQQGFDAAAKALGLDARSYGLPPAVQFWFSDDSAQHKAAHQTFFRELYRRGIFASEPFLLNYAHHPADIDETLAAMQEALGVVAEGVKV
jgi:glutamate-1-semialdehyde 2,1-aminomutase